MSDTTRTWVNLRYRILSNEKRTSLQRGWAGGVGARSLGRAMTECSPHNCGSAVDRARERQFHRSIRAVMAGLDPEPLMASPALPEGGYRVTEQTRFSRAIVW